MGTSETNKKYTDEDYLSWDGGQRRELMVVFRI
jgi:hypothetical protein